MSAKLRILLHLRQLRRLLSDRRGSADLTTYLLITAAGATMVGLTVPSLFESSNAAARTFRGQVTVLEQGAGGSAGAPPGGGGPGGGWNVNITPSGASVGGVGVSFPGNSAGNSGSTPAPTTPPPPPTTSATPTKP